MKTEARAVTAKRTSVLPAIFALVLGVLIVTMSGHLQAETLHSAAHDMRHANGFPCH
ncbi:CbtB domain-containing protein [uncultured Sulfitobacter sp.]|uniref:CbtB domain-containing protein n=1 Tax=uncultured Sulfitobacter sp. TaxID=191468 RepID=UPI0026118073|nr:CbtB domain-containing protein [uncultured Sulfitobacter sp.]